MEQLSVVLSIIDQELLVLEPYQFTMRFDTVRFFGEERQTRVLVAPKIPKALDEFSSLRLRLNAFRKDDWPYNPHITTPSWDLVEKPFTRYVLAVEDKIIKEWEFNP
jgi:hypothetical protein